MQKEKEKQMKKLIASIIGLVVLLSICSVTAFAEYFPKEHHYSTNFTEDYFDQRSNGNFKMYYKYKTLFKGSWASSEMAVTPSVDMNENFSYASADIYSNDGGHVRQWSNEYDDGWFKSPAARATKAGGVVKTIHFGRQRDTNTGVIDEWQISSHAEPN